MDPERGANPCDGGIDCRAEGTVLCSRLGYGKFLCVWHGSEDRGRFLPGEGALGLQVDGHAVGDDTGEATGNTTGVALGVKLGALPPPIASAVAMLDIKI